MCVDKRVEKAEPEGGVCFSSPSLHCQPGPPLTVPLPSGPSHMPFFQPLLGEPFTHFTGGAHPSGLSQTGPSFWKSSPMP